METNARTLPDGWQMQSIKVPMHTGERTIRAGNYADAVRILHERTLPVFGPITITHCHASRDMDMATHSDLNNCTWQFDFRFEYPAR